MPATVTINVTIIDFVGPFKKAANAKKILIVSMGDKNSWPEAEFLHNPTTDNVIEFLHKRITIFGVSRRIRTNLESPFCSERFRQFCREFFFHIEFPVGDHWG